MHHRRDRSRSRSPPRATEGTASGRYEDRHARRDYSGAGDPRYRDRDDAGRSHRPYEDRDAMPDMRPPANTSYGRAAPHAVDPAGLRMVSTTLLSSSVRGRADAAVSAAATASALLAAAVSSASAPSAHHHRAADARFDDDEDQADASGCRVGSGSARALSRAPVDAFGRELRPGTTVDDTDESLVAARARAREYPGHTDTVGGVIRARVPRTDAPLPAHQGGTDVSVYTALGVASLSGAAEDIPEEEAMARLMGFSGFSSTHGKAIKDNSTGPSKGACTKVLKREYRQVRACWWGGEECVEGTRAVIVALIDGPLLAFSFSCST